MTEHRDHVFPSGATRDGDADKLDFDGFLSPRVLHAFACYMHKHRKRSDGSMRASDNWQRGIPRDAYMKSMWRHFFSVWIAHHTGSPVPLDDLCALLFNVQGYTHELLKAVERETNATDQRKKWEVTPADVARFKDEISRLYPVYQNGEGADDGSSPEPPPF